MAALRPIKLSNQPPTKGKRENQRPELPCCFPKWAAAAGDSGTVFVEWEANLPEEGDDTHWMNFGYQLLQRGHIQFDLNGGLGLNSDADDYRLGIGFSYSF